MSIILRSAFCMGLNFAVTLIATLVMMPIVAVRAALIAGRIGRDYGVVMAISPSLPEVEER